MYAATAYIIIEVANNLKSGHCIYLIGSTTLVVIILIAGLPVVVILSWIFDFTPQALKKTKSIEEIKIKETETITQPVKRRQRVSDLNRCSYDNCCNTGLSQNIQEEYILEKLRSSGERISVAVMPFQNLTNDTIWDVWQGGIQNELITSLTNSEELKVRQTETVNSLLRSSGLTNYATIHPSDASKVSQKLEANVFIHGSINQAGSTIRLNARLINSKTENVYKSFQIDGTEENILEIIDSLSAMVKNSLIISKLVKDLPLYEQQYNPSTRSSEAYRYYLYGENARSRRDYPTAIKMFSQALAIDSNFISHDIKAFCGLYKSGLIGRGKEMESYCLLKERSDANMDENNF